MRPGTKHIRKLLIDPIRSLAAEGMLSGILLLAVTIISLVVSNLSIAPSYLAFWKADPGIPFFHLNVVEWINDGLMPVFFLLVGLEIKRELIKGELSRPRKALLPVIAAACGMIFPALIYIGFNLSNPEVLHGWAIPTATDIAFSLGILSLLGKRVPFPLVIFLMALAIIDDLGAILILTTFYAGTLHIWMLLGALGTLALLIALNFYKVRTLWAYLLPGLVLWYFVLHSGIHPTIAGVLLALTIPLPSGEILEHRLTKIVSYVILPVFALANTAIPLSLDLAGNLVSTLSAGVILGLFIGKPLGIVFSSWLMVKTGISPMPKDVNWKMMTGLGMVAGIGFTMSIFITTLSFQHEILADTAKLAVICGSLLSAIGGLVVLRFTAHGAR
ncbi:MAG: Na+/H+ antiporter NhaA [Bacteroidetes bacterium]|nr:Na+/H+ antiporter NhaA [Bacteroidota bacterium]